MKKVYQRLVPIQGTPVDPPESAEGLPVCFTL